MPRTDLIPPGGRWHPHLLAAYRTHGKDATTRKIAEGLDDPETRRIVVDAEQAARFLDAEQPPAALPVRFPFGQCYIEFTSPIGGIEMEPGHADALVALLILQEPGEPDAFAVSALFIADDGEDTWGDSGFGMQAMTGEAFTRVSSCLVDPEPSAFPEGFLERLGDPARSLIVPRTEGDGIGWWERRVGSLGMFTRWIAAYLTAKGIVVVDEAEAPGVSRQRRRALARMAHRPRPWHVVMVDPTRISDEERGAARGVGFRFDVRGHLRFGRHRRGDGSYAQTVEWVRPHQRGLRHTTYVPKTYGYDGASPRPPVE